MQRLLLASFATFFLRTLALRSLRTCAAIRLTTRSFVLRSLGAGAAIRLATLCLGARGVLRCFASLTRPRNGRAAMRRLAAAAAFDVDPAYPNVAFTEERARPVVRVPVRVDRERYNGQAKPRSVLDDRHAIVLIRIAQVTCPDPAPIVGEGDIAPAPVAQATRHADFGVGRQGSDLRKLAARAGEDIRLLQGESVFGKSRRRHRGDREHEEHTTVNRFH